MFALAVEGDNELKTVRAVSGAEKEEENCFQKYTQISKGRTE